MGRVIILLWSTVDLVGLEGTTSIVVYSSVTTSAGVDSIDSDSVDIRIAGSVSVVTGSVGTEVGCGVGDGGGVGTINLRTAVCFYKIMAIMKGWNIVVTASYSPSILISMTGAPHSKVFKTPLLPAETGSFSFREETLACHTVSLAKLPVVIATNPALSFLALSTWNPSTSPERN